MHLTMTILNPVIGLMATTPLLLTTGELQIEFKPRSPEQMISFYEARGFPESMLDILGQQCFITVGIHNTGKTKIWMNLGNWRFSSNGKTIKRIHRDTWKQRWQTMDIPLQNQSTFRWTLIPENLDYLPGEDEGGNVILPFTEGPINLEASFATGDDKQGPVLNIEYHKRHCAED